MYDDHVENYFDERIPSIKDDGVALLTDETSKLIINTRGICIGR